MKRYFLTVDWCSKGNRGIFCDKRGNAFSQKEPHTREQMQEILDFFYVILNPQSESVTKEELKQYNSFLPLHEYYGHYGIAVKHQ